jgi:hypothetical protein
MSADTKAKTGRGPFRVFISYAAKDKSMIEPIALSLKKDKSIQIVHISDLHLGSMKGYADQMRKSLEKSQAFIVHFAGHGTPSANALFEMGYALARGKEVLPVLEKGTDASHIPFDLKSRKAIINVKPSETAARVVEWVTSVKSADRSSRGGRQERLAKISKRTPTKPRNVLLTRGGLANVEG